MACFKGHKGRSEASDMKYINLIKVVPKVD